MTLAEAAFDSLEEMLVATAEAVRPTERITVSEAAERYHRIPGTATGAFDMSKTPYLREPQDTLVSIHHTGMVFIGPARTGKALALDTPINTPSGWSTMGALVVGDTVFSESGAPCKIIATSPIMEDRPCYEVRFSDGAVIVADGAHQWSVSDCHKPDRQLVLTTEEMFPSHLYGVARRSRYAVELCAPIEFEDRNLPLHPYLFGVWLGDGSTAKAHITVGMQDAIETSINLARCGVAHRMRPSSGGAMTIILCAERHNSGRRGGRSLTSEALFQMGMGFQGSRKHIPDLYRRASVEQRRELLRGLMDTDGHVDKRGQLEFCTTSPEIAEGVSELLSGLGYKYCLIKRPAAAKTAHRFVFYARPGDVIFKLDRKQSVVDSTAHRRRTVENGRRYIREIRRVTSVPVRCIQVDNPSSLFLAGREMVATHNSAMFINWTAHTALHNPVEAMMCVHMAQHTARHWSKNDLDKALRNSPALRSALTPGRVNDNTFDKRFLSGMNLEITWPTINNLSGKTVPYTWIMDYDREPIEINDEGDKWTLTKKRTQTARRYGMSAAETSPGFPIEDPKWMPSTPHEAPPTKGLLARYNEGDRRRWYWECPQCHSAFEPHRKLLVYPDSQDPMECKEQVVMVCPHDGFPMKPSMQFELNQGGRWVKEGQLWTPGAREPITGTPRRSPIASFWMFGPAAGFTDWGELVYKLRAAEIDFEKTLSEETLKTVINTDFGEPYLPKSLEGGALPDTLKERARHLAAKGEVPVGVRFLITTIDVQKNCFVCHTYGIEPVQVGEGWMLDVHHVDMWKIQKSKRLDADGHPKPVDPAAYAEDWDLLIEAIERTYPLADGSDRRMAVKLVACDSGGAASAKAVRLNAAGGSGPKVSVTGNAYAFWRRLKTDPEHRQHHLRFHLLKGEPSDSKPLLLKTLPDSLQKDKFAIARGDVPVYAVNSNKAKDQADGMLKREEPGGQVHMPLWFDEDGKPLNIDWLFSQLTSEIRIPAGWRNPARRRNEAFDLLAYLIAFLTHPSVRAALIDWLNPPSWAQVWDLNDMVFGEGGEAAFRAPAKAGPSLADLAGDLA